MQADWHYYCKNFPLTPDFSSKSMVSGLVFYIGIERSCAGQTDVPVWYAFLEKSCKTRRFKRSFRGVSIPLASDHSSQSWSRIRILGASQDYEEHHQPNALGLESTSRSLDRPFRNCSYCKRKKRKLKLKDRLHGLKTLSAQNFKCITTQPIGVGIVSKLITHATLT